MSGVVSAFVLALTILPLSRCASGAESPNGGWDAAWSPDGSVIAFTSGSPHGIPNLWIVRPDGVGLRRLTMKGAHEPKWLPDGKTIAFGTVRSGQPIYMSIAADGAPGSEKPIDVLPRGADEPVWSPDGTLVAFGVVTRDGSSRDLWFARSGGGGASGLTTKFWCREWTWSPDGSKITFVVGKAAGSSLWSASLADKDVKLVYKGFCAAPAYSPDGKRLAIAVPDVRSGWKIRIIDLEKETDKLIGVRSFGGKKITWSLDGKRLFFESSRKGEPAVWSIGVDGKDLQRVTPEGTAVQKASFSPDCGRLAAQIIGGDSYSPELCVCGMSGGEIVKLTKSSESYWAPVWSPDGKRLAFQSDRGHANELYVGSSNGRGRKAVQALVNPDPSEVSWLPDGKKLLVADAGRLFTVDTSGGKDAAKLVPKIENPVQNPQLSAGEIYLTEWLGNDAVISAVKLDGAGKRALTHKPEAKPKEEPSPTPAVNEEEQNTDGAKVSERVLVASTTFFVAQPPIKSGAPTDSGNQAAAAGEGGNPHENLGIMGPHPDTGAAVEQPIPVADLSPAVSPDGKLVAFARRGQIWLVEADGTAQKQLTRFPTSKEPGMRVVSNPVWSPQGDCVLFLSFNDESGKLKLELWIAKTDPGSEHIVYSEIVDSEYGVYYSACTYPPVFTDGGKRIIFTSISSGEPRAATVGLDGADLRELVREASTFPSLDSSSKRLAYVSMQGSLERLCVLHLDSGKNSELFR